MSKSLLCRLGRHRWETVETRDSDEYQRCSRCQRDRDRGLEGGGPAGRYGPPMAPPPMGPT
jgi:Prophage protein (DUF1660)